VLDWTSKQPVLDEHGKPVTQWDGRTTKPHPVTGEEVPDESARVISFRYLNPKKAEWPKAEFIVGIRRLWETADAVLSWRWIRRGPSANLFERCVQQRRFRHVLRHHAPNSYHAVLCGGLD